MQSASVVGAWPASGPEAQVHLPAEDRFVFSPRNRLHQFVMLLAAGQSATFLPACRVDCAVGGGVVCPGMCSGGGQASDRAGLLGLLCHHRDERRGLRLQFRQHVVRQSLVIFGPRRVGQSLCFAGI